MKGKGKNSRLNTALLFIIYFLTNIFVTSKSKRCILNERGSKYSHTQMLGVLLYSFHKFYSIANDSYLEVLAQYFQ